MKERMVINNWYELSEKYPPIDEIVLCTINGRSNRMIYKRTFALLMWCGDHWECLESEYIKDLEVLAWCDIYPYGYSRKKVNRCTVTDAEQN